MLKKCISVLLVLTALLTFTSVSALADKNERSDEPVTTTPGTPVKLVHKPTPDSSSKDPKAGTTPGPVTKKEGGGSDGSGSGTGDGSQPEERWLQIGYGDNYTETTTVNKTETLYYKWYLQSGPGSMSIISSNGPVTASGGGWHAGNVVEASFSAAGDYMVISEQWGKDITTTTVTTKHDLILKHITYDLTGNFIHTEEIIQQPIEVGKPITTTKESEPYMISKQKHPIRMTEPGIIQIPGHYLTTTSKATFSRQYVYTEKCIDAYTNKPFELEVVFDFTANTKIVSVGKPSQLITRYLNQGTMTVTPVAFQILEGGAGSNHVKYWAKFIYPKASVPGGSTMTFQVVVKSKNKGDFTAFEKIDVPVNTFNVRFTDKPASECGEFYPIQGLTGTVGNYVKDFGTITYGGVEVP